MKKIVTFVLLLCMILSLSACGTVEITMQEIFDANQTEALLKNHQSVYVREELDGELFNEQYLTKDYFYNRIPFEDTDWLELMTDDTSYCSINGDCVYYVSITPDGVSDFANRRATRSATAVLSAEAIDYTIESVSKKDGRITVKAFMDQDIFAAEMEELDISSATFEYVLDAKTRGVISITSEYTYNDGIVSRSLIEVTHDADTTEILKTFLAYENQTENLRSVTVVSNPGTAKEESKSVQIPKGLIFGLDYEDEEYVFEVYTDAACTEAYDPYADTDSDLTVYIKWTE